MAFVCKSGTLLHGKIDTYYREGYSAQALRRKPRFVFISASPVFREYIGYDAVYLPTELKAYGQHYVVFPCYVADLFSVIYKHDRILIVYIRRLGNKLYIRTHAKRG